MLINDNETFEWSHLFIYNFLILILTMHLDTCVFLGDDHPSLSPYSGVCLILDDPIAPNFWEDLCLFFSFFSGEGEKIGRLFEIIFIF